MNFQNAKDRSIQNESWIQKVKFLNKFLQYLWNCNHMQIQIRYVIRKENTQFHLD